ncbi:MAG: orotate phosphoribosyltransferase [Pseudomonadota bacterium]
MLSDHDIMAEFEAAEAILRGHFILSSGLHSDTYLQCARVLMNPKRADKLCAALAQKLRAALSMGASRASEPSASEAARSVGQQTNAEQTRIDLVVAPAMGGVVVGYEMGRQLGIETIFCERENGEFTLRRGFAIAPGAKVLMVEDVVTTGKSSLEAVKCVEALGGQVVAEVSLIDRSGGAHGLPFPLVSLLTLDVKTYQPDALPPHLKDTQGVKPGSRWLQKA